MLRANNFSYIILSSVLIIFSISFKSVQTAPFNSVETDYPEENKEAISQEINQTDSTFGPEISTMGFSMELMATTLSPAYEDEEEEQDESTSSPAPEAAKRSNKTAILVGLLFAMTMIVKGVPVIIAYSLPYCSKNSPEDDEGAGKENVEKEIQGKKTESVKIVNEKILEVSMDPQKYSLDDKLRKEEKGQTNSEDNSEKIPEAEEKLEKRLEPEEEKIPKCKEQNEKKSCKDKREEEFTERVKRPEEKLENNKDREEIDLRDTFIGKQIDSVN